MQTSGSDDPTLRALHDSYGRQTVDAHRDVRIVLGAPGGNAAGVLSSGDFINLEESIRSLRDAERLAGTNAPNVGAGGSAPGNPRRVTIEIQQSTASYLDRFCIFSGL